MKIKTSVKAGTTGSNNPGGTGLVYCTNGLGCVPKPRGQTAT